jgi:hypothetical protein
MKKHLFSIICFCIVYNSYGQIIARSAIGSFGSSTSNEKHLVQETAGQSSGINNSTQEKGSSFREGIHQPFYYEIERNDLNALIYPNPNNGQFSFIVDLPMNEVFDYNIIDQNGKIITSKNGQGNTAIPVSIEQTTSGMYYLKIVYSNQVSSFKINVIN